METLEISIPAEKIFEIFGFPFTNTFLIMLLGAVFIFSIFFIALKKPKIVPQKAQNFIEWILESIYNYISSITNDIEKTETIFPLDATLFILILLSNLLELLPGVGVFHFIRSPSSDLNFTLALAITSMALVHIFAIKKIGAFNHLKKYFNLKIFWIIQPSGVPRAYARGAAPSHAFCRAEPSKTYPPSPRLRRIPFFILAVMPELSSFCRGR